MQTTHTHTYVLNARVELSRNGDKSFKKLLNLNKTNNGKEQKNKINKNLMRIGDLLCKIKRWNWKAENYLIQTLKSSHSFGEREKKKQKKLSSVNAINLSVLTLFQIENKHSRNFISFYFILVSVVISLYLWVCVYSFSSDIYFPLPIVVQHRLNWWWLFMHLCATYKWI